MKHEMLLLLQCFPFQVYTTLVNLCPHFFANSVRYSLKLRLTSIFYFKVVVTSTGMSKNFRY